MKRPGGIQPLGISFSCWFSRLSNPSCHLISFAHLWYLLLSASCTSKKSRLSASVNLLILYRMEPLRGKRLSPQYEALGDLLKPSSFLLSNPLMWHKSLWWRNGSPIRRFASGVFTCIFVPCVWRVSYKHSWEAAGEAWMSPLAVLWRKEKRKEKKTLATSQDASGWPGCASCSPTVFEPDSCKSRHCYSPGTYCLVDFQTQTAL